jgi:hypothetical protein
VSFPTYTCPYCWGEVHESATVCMHCAKDLTVFRPLAIQMKLLRDEIIQIKSEVKLQAQKFDNLVEDVRNRSSNNVEEIRSDFDLSEDDASPSQSSFLTLFNLVALTLLVIGLSHWLLLFVYDAPPIQLRIWTILWPALPGYFLAKLIGKRMLSQFLISAFVGLMSVGLMLLITAQIDQVPFWPTNTRDWKESFEYSAAICLSFFTGYLILKQIKKTKSDNNRRISLRVLLEKDKNGEYQIGQITKQVNSLITNIAPIISTATALFAGLNTFTGN